ncbi:NAD(P)-binding protein [Waterburya agarophytonicola K14]|uniref:NAD(P)-binding protein n=1 Tax=Waterburya agarophytonicola KI4 TaxID=2874699 RepID=A0A964FHC3_9CYAN|nr:NAD(P)-binding protein [Waterburya agarophytonicola]MCC0179860.1 NAD(P)-binding protein [Waterburya agarophytonicola KI4]
MSQKGDLLTQKITQNSSCIVIGGGISGLIAATLLQRQKMKVIVLDKGRGIGGRLATRRIKYSESVEGIFDYGTQYFSVKHLNFQTWVDDWLQQGIIKQWSEGFPQENRFICGELDGKPRYCGVNGTRGIAKYLGRDLDVRTSIKVTKLYYDRQWLVETEDKQKIRGDILVMTPPIPQSLALLDNSKITLPPDIRKSLEEVSYHPCIAVLALLAKPSKIPEPGGIAVEDESLIWLADNYQKGISPHGYGVTLQATPNFSETHWDNSDADIARTLFAAGSPWLNSDIIQYQVHRWRYSLPKTLYDRPCLAFFAASKVSSTKRSRYFSNSTINSASSAANAIASKIS